VTETHATPSAEPPPPGPTPAARTHPQPVFPPGRYGRRREPTPPRRRWLIAIVALVVIVATLGISIKLFQQYGQPEYAPQVLRYFDVTNSGISVEFEVQKPADKVGTCIVRARAKSGEEVGAANVDVPLGDPVQVTYRLTTTARPVVVEVPRCSAKS
jgi:Domain of unknown function (DUF4307)